MVKFVVKKNPVSEAIGEKVRQKLKALNLTKEELYIVVNEIAPKVHKFTFVGEVYSYDDDEPPNITDSNSTTIISNKFMTFEEAEELFTDLIRDEVRKAMLMEKYKEDEPFNRMEYFYEDPKNEGTVVFVEHWDYDPYNGTTERECF